MKALLRSSLIALMLLGGYAGLTASANASATNVSGHTPLPFPNPPSK